MTMRDIEPVSLIKTSLPPSAPARPAPSFWQLARMDTWALLGVIAVVTLVFTIPYMALGANRETLAALPYIAAFALALVPPVAWRVRSLSANFSRVVPARARLLSNVIVPMQNTQFRHIRFSYEWQGQDLEGKTSVSGRLAHDPRLATPAPGEEFVVWVDPEHPGRTFLPALYD